MDTQWDLKIFCYHLIVAYVLFIIFQFVLVLVCILLPFLLECLFRARRISLLCV